MKVSVSILKERKNYLDVIEKLNNSKADYIHIDVLDNTFIKTSSFDIDDFKNIEFNKKLDIHLMSSNLEKQINDFSLLNPEYISIHEEVGDTLKYLNKIKNKGIKAGIVINPETDIEKVYPYLEIVDLILIMSVNPGKGGQEFMKSVIGKMQELKEIQDRYNYVIEVDGGINNDTIKYVSNYVDIAVSGSYITDSIDYDKNIENLKRE